MTGLIRAEALRLATTRTYWLLAAGAIAVIAGGIAPTAAATSFTPGTNPAGSVLAIAGLAQTVALIAGALSVTGEFRHKTITPAVLITPRRTPLLTAKLITLAAAGLVFGLAATGMAATITLPLLAARHIPAGVSATGIAATIAGGAIATALAAALGVGVGAIIRTRCTPSPPSVLPSTSDSVRYRTLRNTGVTKVPWPITTLNGWPSLPPPRPEISMASSGAGTR